VKRVQEAFVPDPDTFYIESDVSDDCGLDRELCAGVLLAQDWPGNVYMLEQDQAADYDDGCGLTWHRLGTCEIHDNGEPFYDRVAAIRWALNQGWWVWHTRDGAEAQKWINKQLSYWENRLRYEGLRRRRWHE
jgi:hypothetical protein